MKQNKLIIVIIIAAIIIAGSLVFLGLRLGGNTSSSSGSFAEQLEKYQQDQEQAQIDAQAEQARLSDEQAKNVPLTKDVDHVYGNKDAEITIYDYSDFECPWCKRFSNTPAEIVAANNGKVNTVYRHFPIKNPLATKQALASECASDFGGDEMFFKYKQKIYETTKSGGNGMKESQLFTIAQNLGIDVVGFKDCYESEKYADKVKNDMEGGIAAGVRGTPGVIIKNNKTGEVRVAPGAVPIESLQAIVDELLS